MYDIFELRKMNASDLDQIFRWRNSVHVRGNMINNHIIRWEEHLSWFKKIRNNPKYDFLIFEVEREPIGVVNFSEINPSTKTCCWGFYLANNQLHKGYGTIMGTKGLDYAFKTMRIDTVFAEVLAFNKASIELHKKFGFIEQKDRNRLIHRSGKEELLLSFELNKKEWKNTHDANRK